MYKPIALILAFAGFSPTGAFAQTHFDCASGTGENATIIIPEAISPSAADEPLASGDEIGVFTPIGLCAGVITWENRNAALTVWGNNSVTSIIDGFRAGEEMQFRVYQESTGKVFTNVEASFSMGGSTYTRDGLYRLGSFTAHPDRPAPPELESPAHSSTGVPLAPLLTWGGVEDADKYQIQISTGDAVSAGRVVEIPAGVTEYRAAEKHEGASVSWRVRSFAGSVASEWSEVHTFTTARATITASTGTLAFEATVTGRMITGSIEILNGAESTAAVQLGVYPPSNPFAIVEEPDASLSPGDTSRITVAFAPETTGSYRDTVVVKYTHHGLEKELLVPMHAEAREPDQPREALPVYPSDGAVDFGIGDTLRWSAGAGTTYRLQISLTPDFTHTIIDREQLSDSVFVPDGLAHFTEYHWRVRDDESQWSEPASFRTVLGVPDVIGPEAGAAVNPENIHFVWTAVRGAYEYELRVSMPHSGAFEARVKRTADSSAVISDLPPAEQYIWKVRAINGASTGDWTDPVSFSTTSALPGNPDEPAVDRLVSLYPTPTTGAVTLAYEVSLAQTLSVEIWDAMGRRVLIRSIPVSGPGRYSDRLVFDHLAAGTYWLRLVSQKSTSTLPFILVQ